MIPFDTSVRIMKGTEVDAWGESVPLETIEVKGHLRSQTKLIKNDRGEEAHSTYQLLFPGEVDIHMQDKVQFAGEDGIVNEMHPMSIKWMRELSGVIGFTKVEV